MTTTDVPSDLRESGLKLWRSVVDVYELGEHETVLLVQACRTVDLLDELAPAVQLDGALVAPGGGQRSRMETRTCSW
jgi:hypothetical protein